MANTTELMLPLANLNSQPKRQIDRFNCFAQLTAECHLGKLAPPGEYN